MSDEVETPETGFQHTIEPILPRVAAPLPPIFEGAEDDPEIVRLLAEMDACFAAAGVLDRARAIDVTRLPRAGSRRRHSIPDKRYWSNMIHLLGLLKETELGEVSLRGYRPRWYNEQVNGSRTSTHQWFSALDIRRAGDTSMRQVHEAAKWLWQNRSLEHNMGIGVYAGNIHIDSRRPSRRARWGSRKALLG